VVNKWLTTSNGVVVMTKLLIVTAALAAMVGGSAAYAADPVEPAYDWTGFYGGISAGGSFSDSGRFTELAPEAATDVVYNLTGGVADLRNSHEFIGGAQFGYNYQVNQIVWGIEADVSFIDYSDDRFHINPATGVPLAGGDTFGTKEADLLGTVRGRLGYLADPQLLIYGTGGLAISDLEYGVSDACVVGVCGGGLLEGDKSAGLGWTVGGGWEYAIDSTWSIKGEYLYVRFEGEKVRGDILTGAPGSTALFRATDTQFHIARLGVNFKF
jgi:outer membrane immunogenic protein